VLSAGDAEVFVGLRGSQYRFGLGPAVRVDVAGAVGGTARHERERGGGAGELKQCVGLPREDMGVARELHQRYCVVERSLRCSEMRLACSGPDTVSWVPFLLRSRRTKDSLRRRNFGRCALRAFTHERSRQNMSSHTQKRQRVWLQRQFRQTGQSHTTNDFQFGDA
jgi:hypothetical protein